MVLHTVTAEIFMRNIISYFILLAESSELVAYESHSCVPVFVTQPLQYEIYNVRKFVNAKVRNFYLHENFCDYSIGKKIVIIYGILVDHEVNIKAISAL